jgi:membrane-associated phospholipid phosphatase
LATLYLGDKTMFNLTELIDYLKVPGVVAKLQRLGDILQYVLPWTALSIVAFTGKAELAWAWLYGCLATVAITHVVKKLSNYTRFGQRPNGGKDSFPSGHTAIATAGAAFMWFAFGPVVAAVPVALAALTGLSRVLSKNHWWRDVIGGAVIATACMHVALSM